MRVIVTGSKGFIGSNLSAELERLGYEVFGLDKDNCELSDFKCAHANITKIQPEAIFHLAAQLPDIGAEPEIFFRNNVHSTFNLLESVRALEKKPGFIFASTMNVYGKPKYLPVDEKHPLEPVNIYGLTKSLAESLFRFYVQSLGYKVITLRFSGVFGPGRNSGAIASFISKALKNEDIEIDSDGSDVWDTVHIKDVVIVSFKALEKIDSADYNVFNIGYGKGLIVKEAAESIIALTHSSSKIKFGRMRDRINFYYDISKARKELGFIPSSFEGNLRDFIAYKKSEIGVAYK